MIALLLLAVAGTAAPRCVEPSGPRITAADLASSVPAFAALPPDRVLAYAPQPGFARTVSPAELRQWLGRSEGAEAIRDPLCLEWNLSRPDAAAFQAAMASQLGEKSTLVVLETSQFPIPKGRLAFPLASLKPGANGQPALWHGFVEYAPGQRFDIWARVDVRTPAARLIAVADIPPGTAIAAGMFRAEVLMEPPVAADFATTPDAVTGRVARQLITAGSSIRNSQLTKRVDVKKGDVVRLHVRAGAASIALEATALGPGATGDRVALRVNETGRTLYAVLSSSAEAVFQLPEGH